MYDRGPCRACPDEVQMLYCSLKAFEFLTWISSISSRAQMPCAWTFATTA